MEALHDDLVSRLSIPCRHIPVRSVPEAFVKYLKELSEQAFADESDGRNFYAFEPLVPVIASGCNEVRCRGRGEIR